MANELYDWRMEKECPANSLEYIQRFCIDQGQSLFTFFVFSSCNEGEQAWQSLQFLSPLDFTLISPHSKASKQNTASLRIFNFSVFFNFLNNYPISGSFLKKMVLLQTRHDTEIEKAKSSLSSRAWLWNTRFHSGGGGGRKLYGAVVNTGEKAGKAAS